MIYSRIFQISIPTIFILFVCNFSSTPSFRQNSTTTKPQIAFHSSCTVIPPEKQINCNDTDIKISLFPEGGNLINGFVNRVAVKVENVFEKELGAKLVLLDNEQKEILDFKVSKYGLAEFKFIPENGKNYFISIDYNNQNISFKLPVALESGTLIQLVQFDDHYRVNIQSSLDEGLKGCSYTVEQESNIVQQGKIVKKTRDALIKIPKESIDQGILNFNLKDKNGKVVAQRLFYHKREDLPIKMNVDFQKMRETKKDSISIGFSFENLNDEALTNSCFLIKNLDCPTDFNRRIFHLLSSNQIDIVNGPILNHELEKRRNLEILMLTMNYELCQFQDGCKSGIYAQDGITLQGKVKSIFGEEAFANVPLSLYFKNRNEIGMDKTMTDATGRFSFTNLQFSDTTAVLIQLKNSPENKKPDFKAADYIIELDSIRAFKETSETKSNQNSSVAPKKNNGITEIERRKLDSIYLNANNMVTLENVEVNADKRTRKDGFRARRFLYKEPSQTIDFEELPQTPALQNPLEALRGRVPGLFFLGNEIFLRGISSFNANESKPLLLLDGTPVDGSILLNISFSDIEFIDILKGPRAAIYGSRAAGGVIAVYTKLGRGENQTLPKSSQVSFSHPGLDRKDGVIYWNTAFLIPNGVSKSSIKIPNKKGKYIGVLQGTDKYGKRFENRIIFELPH